MSILMIILIVYGILFLLSILYFTIVYLVYRKDPDNISEDDPQFIWAKNNYANKKGETP